MDKAVDNALKRKKELERELSEINQFLALYERFSGTKAGRSDTQAPHEAVDTSTYRVRRAGPGRPQQVADMVARVIRDAQKPMARGKLVEALELRDVTLPSNDKARYVGTILWRNRDRFVNIPNHGYWLANEPYEPARYRPGDIKDGTTEDGAAGYLLDLRDQSDG